MKKIKIVYPDLRPVTRIFYVPHHREFFAQYFDVEIYDPSKTYDRADTIFIKRLVQTDAWHDRFEELKQQGYKILLDHVEECPDSPIITQRPLPGESVLYCQKWFWYNDSRMYRHNGLHLYQPQRDVQYRGFMPINRWRAWREELVAAMGDRLKEFIWSFDRRPLPNDDRSTTAMHWRSYFNPQWYDHTQFSLVAETLVKGQGFITEKSFKPLAFRHPFMIMGQKHTLKLLQQWGFETFKNLWDESYDDSDDYRQRMSMIIHNIDHMQKQPYDRETQQKIAHNHARFFDSQAVDQGLLHDIVEPVFEIIGRVN